MNDYKSIVRAARISNAGTSEGVRKAWDTRRGAVFLAGDAEHYAGLAKGYAISGGKSMQALDAAQNASKAATQAHALAQMSGEQMDYAGAVKAHKYAAAAHRDAAAVGGPLSEMHKSMAAHHEAMMKTLQSRAGNITL